MRAARALVVSTALAACGGAPKVAQPKAQPAVDAAEAEKGAKDVVTSIYESVGRGDSDGLMTLATEKLVVFGPRRGDALANRSDALVALGKEVSGKKKAPLGGSTLQVVPAAGGHSAWAFDVVEVDGAPLAVTAVLTNTDDIWLVDAAALARTPTEKLAATELARDAVVPPGLGGASKIDAAAHDAVERFQHGLAAQAEWGEDLAARADALVVGPSAGEVARGKKDIKKLWKKRLKANTREVVVGEVAAATTPDGMLAWVSAPVARATDEGPPMPLRAFAIYERGGAGWRLVALQESIAIAEPGAGAALVKKAPPPAPKPVEAAAPVTAAADGDAKPKAKKAKKKKAKPAPVEDDTAPAAVAAEDDAPPVEKPKKKAKKRKKKPVTDDDDVAVRDD